MTVFGIEVTQQDLLNFFLALIVIGIVARIAIWILEKDRW
jgi:hypothetical protein